MSESRVIERHEDMSRLGRLQLIFQEDGDIIVHAIPDPEQLSSFSTAVEFCTVGSGGGKSRHTRAALIALAQAMEKDNSENPIPEFEGRIDGTKQKPLGQMSEPELATFMTGLARKISREMPTETYFTLLVYPNGGEAQYISTSAAANGRA